MTWSNFIWFALPAIALWLTVAGVVYIKGRGAKIAEAMVLCAIAIFALFITLFWIHLSRPPMRTMGETRLWYSLFLSTVGYLAYRLWRYPWIMSFSAVVASVFAIINLAKPEIHSKSLMPALQSGWFVPHVTAYILSYSMLGAATIGAIILIAKRTEQSEQKRMLSFVDNMIYVGYGFLTLGLLMGALWAKEAWGHYWSWDPKETWAFITSAAYLGYIHLRLRNDKASLRAALYLLPIAFILLMITWLGVSYLPSAQNSVHVY